MSGPAHTHGGPMEAYDAYRARVLASVQALAPAEIGLDEADGLVVAEDVHAPSDLPAFASSAMDGFAVRAADVATVPATLEISGRVRMGRRPDVTVEPGRAVGIATGAPIPDGADCVVPIEDCTVEGERVTVNAGRAAGAHVRPAAQDVRTGDVLVPEGRRLLAAELGLVAAAGLASVRVHPRPRVAIVSTGDELVPPGWPVEYGQVHDANQATLHGAILEMGARPVSLGIVGDEPEQLRAALAEHLAAGDVEAIVTTAGVSMGERDVVKAAFQERGEVEFVRVAMQPGMPQGFGSVEGVPLFALPGNVASVFVSFEVLVRPALLKLMGRTRLDRPKVSAVLETNLAGPMDRTRFARVEVTAGEEGGMQARATGGRESNLLSPVARANGLAVVPAGMPNPSAGETVTVRLFRDPDQD